MRAPLNVQGSKSWHGDPRPVSLTKQTHVHRLFSVGALVLWKWLHICISCRCSAGWVKRRAQISLQYSASVLFCLRTYPWFIFHLRGITEIVEEVVGWVREFKWRPMSHSEFAGFQKGVEKEKKQSAADCCLTGPVRLRDSRFMWQWWAPSPAGDAGRFGLNSRI